MNLIHKIKFDIRSSKKEVGQSVLNKISDLLDRDFYPHLDRIINETTEKNSLFKFEKIDIELPPVSEASWESEIPEYLLKELQNFILENIPKANSLSPQNISENAVKYTTNESIQELVLHFIQHGRIPENTISNNLLALLKEVEITDALVEKIIAILLDQPHFIIRFFYNLDEEFIYKFIQRAIKNEKFTFKEYRTLDTAGIKLKARNQGLDIILFLNHLISISSNKSENSIPYFITLLRKYVTQTSYDIEKFISELIAYTKTVKVELPVLKILQDKLIQSSTIAFKQKDQKIEFEQEKSMANLGNKLGDIEPIFIENSGLVLLHAFLPEFFKNLGYIDSDSKFFKHQQIKAALALQFLMSGQNKFFENELALNKILCGVDIDEVVPVNYKLTTKEKKQADLMLNALIGHWQILKNTSIEGLRESFLHRSGKLTLREEGFHLQVEGKAFDILLDKFPYGFSYIYLPWMKKPITVDWN